jgi:hypothetical protein
LFYKFLFSTSQLEQIRFHHVSVCPSQLPSTTPNTTNIAASPSPLRLKTQVRDLWTSPTSLVQRAISSLVKLLGKPVDCSPDWVLLYNELKGSFPDPSTLVPTVAVSIAAWASALEDVAGDDANEEWVEKMLDCTASSVQVVVAVSFPSRRNYRGQKRKTLTDKKTKKGIGRQTVHALAPDRIGV